MASSEFKELSILLLYSATTPSNTLPLTSSIEKGAEEAEEDVVAGREAYEDEAEEGVEEEEAAFLVFTY